MFYELRIGLRYLHAAGTRGRLFTIVTVMGVVLGVAALTVAVAVTSGFQAAFRDRVLGVTAHITVIATPAGMTEYRRIEAIARQIDPDVVEVRPFIFVEMLASRGNGEMAGVMVKGVPAPPRRPGARPTIAIGRGLAKKLRADVGDRVTVVAPQSPEKSTELHIAEVFYIGFSDYDERLIYASLADAQALVGWDDQVLGVEITLRDPERAPEVARRLETTLASGRYAVQDWGELNRNLFSALTVQKVVLIIILTLIVAVAAFNMVAALTMMVTDKTCDIAILKAMGATSGAITRVFQVIGMTIASVGTVLGLGLGVGVCALLARHAFALDPRVYMIDHLPIDLRPLEVVVVGAITLLIGLGATIWPSRRAASMAPLDGLRHD